MTTPALAVDRLPPQAVEEERLLVGACIADGDEFRNAVSVIDDPAAFYQDKHRQIYAAMQALSSRREPIDILTVHGELQRSGKLALVGGITYLRELNEAAVLLSNVEWYARIVQEKFLRRQVIALSSGLQRAAFDESEELADSLQRAVSKFMALQLSKKKRTARHISEWLHEFNDQLDEGPLRRRSNSPRTGFGILDSYINGFDPGYLTYIAARPGEGKSTLTGQIAENIAANYGPVVFFSNELSGGDVVRRLIAVKSLTPNDTLDYGPEEAFRAAMEPVGEAMKRMATHPLYLTDDPMSVNEMRIICQDVMVRESRPLSAVFLDRIELLDGMAKNARQYERITEASRQVKNLAKELKTHVIGVVQLKRPAEFGSPKPKLTDLRDSGALEQDAQIVMAIHHEEFDKVTQRGEAEVCILKNTGGTKDDVRFTFQARYPGFFEGTTGQ